MYISSLQQKEDLMLSVEPVDEKDGDFFIQNYYNSN